MPRHKVKRPWLDYVVYLAVRAIVVFAQALPIAQAYALARLLAWVMYKVDKRHRQVGLDNLRLAYGEQMTDADRDQMVRGVYRHFCMMLMEIFHTPKTINLANYRKYITLVGHEPILERMLSNEPMILLSGHYGNWEMAGYVFGLFGFPTYSVARALDNPYLDRYLRSFREQTGQRMIPKAGGYDQIVEVLQTNKPLSMLADQDAGQRGMFVDFFGRQASTHKAIALLAIEHNAPIMVGVARRIGPGFRYELRCAEIIQPSELSGGADDVKLLTQRYTSALEDLIRRDPTQYLWLHRRWKHQPTARKKPAKAQEMIPG
ncbi:lysophospholipid acyltransferase family protein [Paludisphaera borealis]|uniref:Lipid A biosynthesis lauroyltransferase n=1 Tax=Paludisphaera borealis TaxID=1387353 RepID=A0A1U7CL15_9BACT|nr:lysophospholipid acyltransferase family protein [Paludisphaera borealis]APW59634.1 Lipid A biosynthesis lauroyltransferase [Paludisphaera borealis]